MRPWSCIDQSINYFFFFQAEDGIRDLTVTGVQTCALPISHGPLDRLEGDPGGCRVQEHQRPEGRRPGARVGGEEGAGGERGARARRGIGRGSGRGRGEISVVAVSLKKKKRKKIRLEHA